MLPKAKPLTFLSASTAHTAQKPQVYNLERIMGDGTKKQTNKMQWSPWFPPWGRTTYNPPHPALNHHPRKGKACQSPNLKCSVHSEVCQLQTEGSVSWEPKGTRKGGSSKPNDPTPQTKTGANRGTPGFSKDLIESIQSPQKRKKKRVLLSLPSPHVKRGGGIKKK